MQGLERVIYTLSAETPQSHITNLCGQKAGKGKNSGIR